MIAIGSSPNWGEGDLQRMSARQATGGGEEKGTPLEEWVGMSTVVLFVKRETRDYPARLEHSNLASVIEGSPDLYRNPRITDNKLTTILLPTTKGLA